MPKTALENIYYFLLWRVFFGKFESSKICKMSQIPMIFFTFFIIVAIIYYIPSYNYTCK